MSELSRKRSRIGYDFDTDTYLGCPYCRADVEIKGGEHCPVCAARMLTTAEVARLAEKPK